MGGERSEPCNLASGVAGDCCAIAPTPGPSLKGRGVEKYMRYLPLTDTDRQEMLSVIGAETIDDLFIDVPAEARLSGTIAGLPDHASELAVERHMGALARKNLSAGEAPFFLGAGAYKHHVPASVDHLIQRGEFLTAYTPYQPEIAQGTLQVLFEFQTQVARLLGVDVANASMYDGSTACWEAIGMARRITKRGKALLSSGLHPHYVSVANTMAKFTGDALVHQAPTLDAATDIDALIASIDKDTSCVVVQYPDILGRIADLTQSATEPRTRPRRIVQARSRIRISAVCCAPPHCTACPVPFSVPRSAGSTPACAWSLASSAHRPPRRHPPPRRVGRFRVRSSPARRWGSASSPRRARSPTASVRACG